MTVDPNDLKDEIITNIETDTGNTQIPAAQTVWLAVSKAIAPHFTGGGSAVDSVTAGSTKVSVSPTTGNVVVDVVPANLTGIPESGVTGLTSDLAAKAPTSRTINTTSPITGGGDLTADRTIGINAALLTGIPESAVTNLTSDLAAKVPTTRTLSGTSPIRIDGGASADLSADRTVSILTTYLAALCAFLFGSGADGALVFDGTTTVLGMVPSANVYTMTRNIYASSITVNTGVTIKTAGWMILCSGTITGAGTALIHGNGNAAVGSTAGAASWTTTSTFLGGGGAGANGSTGNGANGGIAASSAGATRRFAAGANAGVGFGVNGVTGGTGQGGSGGSSISGLTSGGAVSQPVIAATLGDADDLLVALYGKPFSASAGGFAGGSGGGAGAGDNVTPALSGGSGGGAGWVVVRAKAFAGTLTISAKGGNGGNAAGGNAAGGAGGGGGGLVVVAGSGTLPTLDVSGGTHGTSSGSGRVAGDGGPGIIFSTVLAA